jgi:hypothetical protein
VLLVKEKNFSAQLQEVNIYSSYRTEERQVGYTDLMRNQYG